MRSADVLLSESLGRATDHPALLSPASKLKYGSHIDHFFNLGCFVYARDCTLGPIQVAFTLE
jgi:hypothetical protein